MKSKKNSADNKGFTFKDPFDPFPEAFPKDKIPQGWQCPACKRINSPTSSSCPCLGVYPSAPIYPYRPYYPPYYVPPYTIGDPPWWEWPHKITWDGCY